ncbi:MAG: transcriptional regulator, partial [Spirochaetota bacterium]
LTRENLKQAVIEYEQKQFYKKTRFDKIFPEYDLVFTATGRYDEVLQHIYGHKYYINQSQQEELPFEAAMRSWYHNVLMPIVETIREQKILGRFPGRTEADLYVWLVKHWDELKRKYGADFSLEQAATDLSERFGQSILQRIRAFFKRRREEKERQKKIARGEIIE